MLICFSSTVIWQQKHDVTTESRREAERWNFFQIIPSLKTCWFACCCGSIAVGNKLSTGFSVPHIYGPVLVLNYGAWLKMLGILWYTTIKASRRVFVAQHLDNEMYKNGTQSKPKHCSLASRSSASWKIQPVWMETKTLYLCAVCAFDALHSVRDGEGWSFLKTQLKNSRQLNDVDDHHNSNLTNQCRASWLALTYFSKKSE